MRKWWQDLKPNTRKWIIGVTIVLGIASAVSPDPEAKPKPKHTGPHVVDVRGLTLPEARKQLKAHGNYAADANADDAVFGVIVEENFTVCKQSKPKGHLVPLKVAKRDC